jgi:hypothetical protein
MWSPNHFPPDKANCHNPSDKGVELYYFYMFRVFGSRPGHTAPGKRHPTSARHERTIYLILKPGVVTGTRPSFVKLAYRLFSSSLRLTTFPRSRRQNFDPLGPYQFEHRGRVSHEAIETLLIYSAIRGRRACQSWPGEAAA